MNGSCRIVLVGCLLALAGCAASQPPRKQTIAVPALSCEEANRLAYRTVTVLGYTAASLQIASPGQSGHILARKEGVKDGMVTITCNSDGAIVEPEKTGIAVPSLIGPAERPGEFPQIFKQTFNILRSSQEAMAAKGPEKGLNLTMTPLNSFESQIELGADLPASGVLPIKVVIANNTSRPYGVDVNKIFLQPAALAGVAIGARHPRAVAVDDDAGRARAGVDIEEDEVGQLLLDALRLVLGQSRKFLVPGI